MIVPINIDFSGIRDAFSLGQEEVNEICDNVAKSLAASYYSELVKLASVTLHTTYDRYFKAVRVVNTGKMEGTVILDYSKDPLVRMLEEGASAWDMKGKMLSGPKHKVGKNGNRYVTVPFNIGSAGVVADSRNFSTIMPKPVYNQAKKLIVSMPSVNGLRSPGLTVDQLPAQYQSPAKRAEIKDSEGKLLFEAFQHQTSIYEGVFKLNDAVTNQNTYHSFRRISDNSPENSWVNSGIEAYNLVSRALNSFDQLTETDKAMNAEFQRLGLF